VLLRPRAQPIGDETRAADAQTHGSDFELSQHVAAISAQRGELSPAGSRLALLSYNKPRSAPRACE
jgi:hypothetical protein